MKRMKKQLLTALCAAAMAATCIVPAYAETTTPAETQTAQEAEVTAFQKLIDDAKEGSTIKLDQDYDLTKTAAVTKKLTIDLNGHTISNTASIWDKKPGDWSLISVREGGNLTIKGDGALKALKDDCYALDVQDGGKLTVESGTYVGNISALYITKGSADIKGGDFSIQQLSDNKPYEFTLNLLDKAGKAGEAKISVSGGTFSHFNPAANAAESSDDSTNFVADGYVVKAESGSKYTVVADPAKEAAEKEKAQEDLKAANEKISAAQKELDKKDADLAKAQEDLKAANEKISAAQKELDKKDADLAKAQKDLKAADEKLSAAQKAADDNSAALEKAQKELEAAKKNLADAQSKVTKPAKTKIVKLSKGKKKFTVKWKKVKKAEKYQIQYATSKNFKKGKKTVSVKKTVTKKTIKKLAAGKKYYVRVRSYRKAGGKKLYSKWSAVKTVKTAK